MVDFTTSPITHLILTFMSMHILVCVNLSKGSAGYPAIFNIQSEIEIIRPDIRQLNV